MANNRLYIYDPNTNKAVMIAKGWGSGFWDPSWMFDDESNKVINEFFAHCFDGSSISGQATKLRLATEKDLPHDAEIFSRDTKIE